MLLLGPDQAFKNTTKVLKMNKKLIPYLLYLTIAILISIDISRKGNWSGTDLGNMSAWFVIASMVYFWLSRTYSAVTAWLIGMLWPMSWIFLLLSFLGGKKSQIAPKPVCRNCGHKIGFSQTTNVHLGLLKLTTNPCEKEGKKCIPV